MTKDSPERIWDTDYKIYGDCSEGGVETSLEEMVSCLGWSLRRPGADLFAEHDS